MEAAREVAQLRQRLARLPIGGVDQLHRPVGALGQLPARQRERHRERDQPLLRAVVQVALEPSPLLVRRPDEPRPRLEQLLARVGAGDRE